MNLDLTDEETAALVRLLHDAIDADHFPLSPRVQTWRAVLGRLRPEPAREPRVPQKVYAPPKASLARRRRARG
jgi:hypothetical protein